MLRRFLATAEKLIKFRFAPERLGSRTETGFDFPERCPWK
jgi:hypothetical protein